MAEEVERTADGCVLRDVLLSGLTVLSLLDLNVPEASALHLLLLGNLFLRIGKLVVSLKLTVEVSLVDTVLAVDVLDSLIVTVGSHLLHVRVVDVTLHVVHGILEMGVGSGSVAVQRLVNLTLNILAHGHHLAGLVVHQERLVNVELGSRLRLELAEARST